MDQSDSIDDFVPTFIIGQHESERAKLPVTEQDLRQAQGYNYDMLTTPITRPAFHSRVFGQLGAYLTNLQYQTSDTDGTEFPQTLNIAPLSSLDTTLKPGEHVSSLLAVVSPWIDLCSPDPFVYEVSRQVLCLETAYAAFCGISNVIIDGPKLRDGNMHGSGLTQYARALQEVLGASNYIQISIILPTSDSRETSGLEKNGNLATLARGEYLDEGKVGSSRKAEAFGSWDAWHFIRTVCKYNARLFVALSLEKQIPSHQIRARWHSEPLRLLTIDSKVFLPNPKRYPVLSKPHQSLISSYMRLRNPPWILLCDVGPIPGLDGQIDNSSMAQGSLSPSSIMEAAVSPTPAEAAQSSHQANNKKNPDPTPHLSYIRHLQQKQPPRTTIERYGTGWQDYLQSPLQPLTDDLESITYEVFEKDPVKYDAYERAIARALNDWSEQEKPTSHPNGHVVVVVAGAGRGPLVTRALRASESVGVKIELWAVEKNPNAYVLLQHHNEEDWQNQVNLVQSDMRAWKGPWHENISFLAPSMRRASYNQLKGEAPSAPASSIADSMSLEPTQNDSNSSSSHLQQQSIPSTNGFALTSHKSHPQSGHTPVDILISELLGSFGDNELSPECLDGANHLLSPHGLSIPQSYTSFITPIAAPKLYADVLARSHSDPHAFETPYVVMLHAIDFLSSSTTVPGPSNPSSSAVLSPKEKATAPDLSRFTSTNTATSPPPISASSHATPPTLTPSILPAWTFTHRPNPNSKPTILISNTHNQRSTHLTFRTRDRGACHGLAGYFEAVLYPGVELSTNPNTMDSKSPEMISWFPIFFPLKTPFYIPDHSSLSLSMWRRTDDRKVWYEWLVESFGWNLLIGGEKRAVRLGVGELMSSKSVGCMM